MMSAAAAAMGMKVISSAMLRRFGYRQVLIVNTVQVACTISVYTQIGPGTPIALIVPTGGMLGLFNSLQFSSMNSMAYADVAETDAAMASTIASTLQQLSMSFGLACGSLVTAWYLADLPQTNRVAVTTALHHSFLTLAGVTLLSSATFWRLRPDDGDSISRGRPAAVPAAS
jgi:hypothetical protein